jgi:hypothetical protein
LLSVHDIKLTLMVASDGAMVGGIDYRADLFSDSTVCRLARCLSELVTLLAAQPDMKVSVINRKLEDLWEGNGRVPERRSWKGIRSQRVPVRDRGVHNA